MNPSLFQKWLLLAAPSTRIPGVVAYNFNIAEAGAGWVVELIGAATYDSADPDWSCPPEAWTSRPINFVLSCIDLPTWEEAQEFVLQQVREFIQSSPAAAASVLRGSEAVCVAFVDGDHSVIWSKE